MRARAPSLCAAAVLAALGACAPAVRRFPLAEPLWRDDDARPIARRPAEYESVDVWDFVDQSLFRPARRALLVETRREAVNVNAMDEVPDSSWFTNRLGRGAISADDLVRGDCLTAPLDPAIPWSIVGGKPNGVNPGFMVRGPDGQRYMLKPDGPGQPELGTASDTIGSRIYHAVGFNTACVRVVAFDRSILRIDPRATYRDAAGNRQPMTWAQIEPVLRNAVRLTDGRLRMEASQFIPGAPLGPFTYQGVREDDPNDVVPHEDRRELRGARILAAWLNHYDAREQNTFTSWADAGANRGYVRHWMLDFGDSFGNLWPFDAASRRSGHTHPLDFQHVAEDTLALGLVRRPWDHARVDRDAWIFGYFRADDFDPEAWRSISPNPAFVRMTERDGAWMARILARFDDAMIHTAVATGEFSYAPWTQYLERTLAARRQRILARYLTRLSPLSDVTLAGDRVCALDLATAAGLRPAAQYVAVRYSGGALERRDTIAIERPAPARACAVIPGHLALDGGLPDGHPARYVIVDIVGGARGRAPLRVHLYDLGPARGYRLVGVERPGGDTPPRG